jgi:hypothetical protein
MVQPTALSAAGCLDDSEERMNWLRVIFSISYNMGSIQGYKQRRIDEVCH